MIPKKTKVFKLWALRVQLVQPLCTNSPWHLRILSSMILVPTLKITRGF
jgi:hypothetical protein